MVVGGLREVEALNIVKEESKFRRKAFTKFFSMNSCFNIQNFLVLILLVYPLRALPRKSPSQQVYDGIGQPLQIVPPTLLNPKVTVDRSVASSADEALPLLETDVVSLLAPVEFGDAVVYQKYSLEGVHRAHYEVFWFDVPVDEVLGVEVLHSL